MSDQFDENEQVTENDIISLMQEEREKEIKQIATVQGQIIALVVTLRKMGIMQKQNVDDWERYSDDISDLIIRIARAEDVKRSPSVESPNLQLKVIIDGLNATISLMDILNNSYEAIERMKKERDRMVDLLKETNDQTG